jgi:hypothetical protein
VAKPLRTHCEAWVCCALGGNVARYFLFIKVIFSIVDENFPRWRGFANPCQPGVFAYRQLIANITYIDPRHF